MSPTEILLVEDNAGDAVLLLEAFQRSGWQHRLHRVRTGAEALDFLFRRGAHGGAGCPDLILLDLNLPIKNGREVLAETRMDARVAAIPVIILSGSEWDRPAMEAVGLPEGCYFVKPMTFQGYLDMAESLQSRFGQAADSGR